MGNELNCMAALTKKTQRPSHIFFNNEVCPQDDPIEPWNISPYEARGGLKDFYQFMTGDANHLSK